MTDAGLDASMAVTAVDEHGNIRDGFIAAERALTVYLDKREIVTLMTLGTQPELLVLGWLRNQRLVPDIDQIKAIQVDWETESAVITTHTRPGLRVNTASATGVTFSIPVKCKTSMP